MINYQDFLGNDDVKERLSSAFDENRFPHAIIIQGDTGLGKFTFAKILANALVCEDKPHAPCGKCPACIRAAAGSHPDIKIIAEKGDILVDSVNFITEDAYRKPEESDYNIYILRVNTLINESAQNKLLKIIEEPPEGTVFFILVRSADYLLQTIRSRSEIFTLYTPEISEAASFVASKTGISEDEAEKASEMFSGNIGKMLAYLDGSGSSIAQETAILIARLVMAQDEHLMLAALAKVSGDYHIFAEMAECLELIFRDACVIKEGSDCMTGIAHEESVKIADSLMLEKLVQLPEICRDYAGYARKNCNMTILATAFSAKLRSAVYG
jgi:DNA polymerase-3 subunit delta'